MSKKILMIAGPNGAGKTTITFELMRHGSTIYEFLNADEIAKCLAPLHPDSMALKASKLMITRLLELLEAGKSFAFETTGYGINYIKHLQLARKRGYEIHLTFLWLANPEQAIKRVAQRVKQGGHDIPTETIIRRYYAGIKNLVIHYMPISDEAMVIDNSKEASLKKIIAKKEKNSTLDIIDKTIWKKIEEVAHER
ncbi:MAG: AAA family ATPase [Chlamydiae bacterium]|nr:AAA family ATPase [Chlamydiota bacterium]